MSPGISLLLQRLAGDDVEALARAVCECSDIDERLPDGESAVFHAVLSGRADFVRILLERGADPNFRAAPPAEDSLAPTPLDLAQQARILMDWGKYQPTAEMLQGFGARDRDGRIEAPEELQIIEARARAWQANRR